MRQENAKRCQKTVKNPGWLPCRVYVCVVVESSCGGVLSLKDSRKVSCGHFF